MIAEHDWRVAVDGRSLDLQHVDISIRENNEPAENLRLKGVWYQYGSFTLHHPATVRLACGRKLDSLEILPRSSVPSLKWLSSNEVEFVATRPFKLSFRPEGRVGALHLFADAPDPQLPRPNGKDVIYFSPGTHVMDWIKVRSNETLFLDEGSLVYGHLDVRGTNITVCGSGILSGAKFVRFKGPGYYSNAIVDATNVTVRGVTFTDPYCWTVGVKHSRFVTLDGVKVMGGRMINDDGIDVINSSDVTIRNAFIRTQDDNIGLKGLGYEPDGRSFAPVENILVEGCQLWTDQANNFRLGFECDAAYMRSIRIRDCDILASSPIPRNPNDFWGPSAVVKGQVSGGMVLSDLDVENLRVNADGTNVYFVVLESALTWSRRKGEGRHRYTMGGSIRNCRFANIEIAGQDAGFGGKVRVRGRSQEESVRDVAFENIIRFGRPLEIPPSSPKGMTHPSLSDNRKALKRQDCSTDVRGRPSWRIRFRKTADPLPNRAELRIAARHLPKSPTPVVRVTHAHTSPPRTVEGTRRGRTAYSAE